MFLRLKELVSVKGKFGAMGGKGVGKTPKRISVRVFLAFYGQGTIPAPGVSDSYTWGC